MAKDLKAAAQDALDFNTGIDQVFVTADGGVFTHKNDAVNHARILDDKTVEVFNRSVEGQDEDEPAGDDKPMPAKDLVKLLEGAESEQAVTDLLANDERVSVKTAAAKRLAELKQIAIDAQAAAADEALKNRTGE